jgi:hypothetical protein
MYAARWWFSPCGHKWTGLESEGEDLRNRIQAFTKKYQGADGFNATMQTLVGYTYTCLDVAEDVEACQPATTKTLASEGHDLILRIKGFFGKYKDESEFNRTMNHIVGLTSKLALASGALDELSKEPLFKPQPSSKPQRASQCMPEDCPVIQHSQTQPISRSTTDKSLPQRASECMPEDCPPMLLHSQTLPTPRSSMHVSTRPRRSAYAARWWFSPCGHKWRGLENEGRVLRSRIQAFTKQYQGANGFNKAMQQLVGYTYSCLNVAEDVETCAPETVKTLASESHDLLRRIKAFFGKYKDESEFNTTMQQIVDLTFKLAQATGALEEFDQIVEL